MTSAKLQLDSAINAQMEMYMADNIIAIAFQF